MFNIDIGSVLTAFMREHRIAEWSKLIFTLAFSTFFASIYSAARSLLRDEPPIRACGRGLMSGALCGIAVFRKSPLTKDMIVVLPGEEAADEMDLNQQTISK